MNITAWLQGAASALVLSLLAACGGSSDSPSTLPATFVQPDWASPALLVSPGQTSKTFSLKGCTWSDLNGNSGAQGTLHTATLVVSSTGTLTMNGATATTATIGPVLSYSIGGASERERRLFASASNGIATNLIMRFESNEKLMPSFDLSQTGMGISVNLRAAGVVVNNTTVSPSVFCSDSTSTQTFALSVPPSDSRTQAVFVASGQTARLSWLAQSTELAGNLLINQRDFRISSGGPALHLDQATGIMSLANTTSTTATLRPLSISGAEYFNSAGSSSTYEERLYVTPAVGQTPAAQSRQVRLQAYVPTASPAIDIDVYLCSATGPVQALRCPEGVK